MRTTHSDPRTQRRSQQRSPLRQGAGPVRRVLAGAELEQVLDRLSGPRPGHVPAGVPIAQDVAAAARTATRAATGALSARAVRDVVSAAEMLTCPYWTIGVLRVRRRGDASARGFPGGSGVLVGPYHLLTATHVLEDEDGKGSLMSVYEHRLRRASVGRAAPASPKEVAMSSWTIASAALLSAAMLASLRRKTRRAAASVERRDLLAVPPAPWAAIGGLEALAALGLVVGLFRPVAGAAAAVGVGLLMLGAIAAHPRVRISGRPLIPPAVLLLVSVLAVAGCLRQI